MQEINNVIYSTQINYVDDKGSKVSITKKIDDKGLEMTSIQVGDICISEETINGRVLSGKYDNSVFCCGYKYNYEKDNDEYLVNINKDVSLGSAVSLINKTKMQSEFLSAKMVLCSILRNDYRVITMRKGNLNVIKTVQAENENQERYFLEENSYLSKSEGEELFSETKREKLCKVNDNCVNVNNNIEKLRDLIAVIKQNPSNYKELQTLKMSLNTAHTI